MLKRWRWGGRLLVIVSLLLGTACAGGSRSAGTPSGNSASAGGNPGLVGSLTVLAAASLSESFSDAEVTLEHRFAGFKARYSFAGSQQLVANILSGAPADIIATADTATMQKLVDANLVEPPRTFARNRLEIAVAKGNPKAIHGLAALARADVSVVLADPAVPAGKFAKQALQRAGVMVTPKSLELDVKSVLRKVASGDADAGIVYATDVSAARGQADGVLMSDSQNVIAMYPIATVRASQNRVAADAFVEEAVRGDIQKALLLRGFLPP